MERRAADAPRGGFLAIGEVIGVEEAQRFLGAFEQVVPVALERLHPADIDIAQVEGFLAILHPLRQRHARAAR